MNSSDENQQTNADQQQQQQQLGNSITESTVLITTSQIIDSLGGNQGQDSMDKSFQFESLSGSQMARNQDTIEEEEQAYEQKKQDEEDVVVEQQQQQLQNDREVVSLDHESKTTNDTAETNDENEASKVVELNDENIIKQQESEELKSSNDMDNIDNDYEILQQQQRQKQQEEQDALEKSITDTQNEQLDAEISDLRANIENAIQTSDKIEDEKPVKSLENEKFVKLLGNDSLMKKIVAYGNEEEERPRTGQMVTVNYRAFIRDSTDSIVEEEQNYSFIVGDGDVVSGLDMAVSLMYKNEKAEVVCDARHAYSTYGKLPTIQPNTNLRYEVHLVDIQNVKDYSEMNPIERLSLTEFKKTRGNFNFNRQDFHAAIVSYKRALKFLNRENLRENEEPSDLEKFTELAVKILMNLSLSYYKIADYKMSLETLEELLSMQSKHQKALYIKGKCLVQLGETSEAIKCFTKSLELDPTNSEVKNELAKAQVKHKSQYEKEKKMYQKMMSGVSEKPGQVASKKSKTSQSSNYLGYIAAGVFIAVASVSVAMLVKYRNVF